MSQPLAADRVEQPLKPDTQVPTIVGITLSTSPIFRPSTVPVVGQVFSGSSSFGILSTYPPTLCRLATFSAAPADGLNTNGVDVRVVRFTQRRARV
jgi:hypothetical protein